MAHHGQLMPMNPNALTLLHSKPLSATSRSLNGSHAWPNRFREEVWGPNTPDHTPILVADLDRVIWSLGGHLRVNPNGNPRPEVYGPEWRRFLSVKRPRRGDILCYYSHPDPTTGVAFVLCIKRQAMTLMGQPIFVYI